MTVVEWIWRPTAGLACNDRPDPLVFDYVPWVAQEELFSDIDSMVSVSASTEAEATVAFAPIDPSSQLVLFESEAP